MLHHLSRIAIPFNITMGKVDNVKDDLEQLIDTLWLNNGRVLIFNLSCDVREKLRDNHVISIINKCSKKDKITHISLDGCTGITDVTLKHIANTCTQLEELFVPGCVKITDYGIKAIVEKAGPFLTNIDISGCNRCTDATLQVVVQRCPKMEYLHAGNAGITQIPETIGQDLPNLWALGLESNKIERLPPSIALLDSTMYFHISNNPLQDPPLHIAERGMEAISDYFTHAYIEV